MLVQKFPLSIFLLLINFGSFWILLSNWYQCTWLNTEYLDLKEKASSLFPNFDWFMFKFKSSIHLMLYHVVSKILRWNNENIYQIIILPNEFYYHNKKRRLIKRKKEKSNYLFHRKKQMSNSEVVLKWFWTSSKKSSFKDLFWDFRVSCWISR